MRKERVLGVRWSGIQAHDAGVMNVENLNDIG